jgi:hypothetical protein
MDQRQAAERGVTSTAPGLTTTETQGVSAMAEHVHTTTSLTRRAVLRAGAASAALVAPAGLALASAPSDPLLALWERRAALLPLCTGDDATVDRIGALISDVERQMIETPSASVGGLRVKINMLHEYFGFRYGDGGIDLDMLRSTLEDAERLAGGAS